MTALHELLEMFAWLGDAIWQSSAVLGVALLASHVCTRRAALGHVIAMAGLITAPLTLLLAAVTRLLGVGLLSALPMSPAPPVELQLELASVLPAGTNPVAILGWTVIGVWACSSVVLVVRVLAGAMRARALIASAHTPTDPLHCDAARRAVQQARAMLNLQCAIDVRLSSAVQTPIVWCWSRRPVIILPVGIFSSDRQNALAAIIAHELSHVHRRDHVWMLLGVVACCIVPWNPLAWMTARRAEQLSEHACDQLTVWAGHDPQQFARELLRFATPASPSLMASMSSHPRALRGRIEHLYRSASHDAPSQCSRCVIAMISIVFLTSGLCAAAAHRAQRTRALDTDTQVMPSVDVRLLRSGRGIAMLPAELDLGPVAPGAAGTGVAWIVNLDTRPIAVTDLSRSCGCTTVDGFEPRVLHPGEAMTLHVAMEAPEQPNQSKTRQIIVSADGQDPIRMPVHLHTTELTTFVSGSGPP